MGLQKQVTAIDRLCEMQLWLLFKQKPIEELGEILESVFWQVWEYSGKLPGNSERKAVCL